MGNFSIALCTYNGERHLRALLASLASQVDAPAELVACDDRSTDGTLRLLQDFERTAPFPVRVEVNDRNLGAAKNFERAFSLCRAGWIAPCDQDDVWHFDKLQRFAQELRSVPAAGLVFGDLALVSSSGDPLAGTQWQFLGFTSTLQEQVRRGRALDVLLRFNVVNGTAMAFRADLASWLLPIPSDWLHDEWVALLASAVADVAIVTAPVVDYRVHDGQQVGPAVTGLFSQVLHARRHMGHDYFERKVRRSEEALERLQTSPLPLHGPGVRDRFVAQLDHARARLRLRGQTLRRPLTAIRELRCGNYRRFGYGWKSFMQDLLL